MTATPGPADSGWPAVDIVIPIHNEAGWIEDKLANTGALDYPVDRLRCWVVDGASTDGTADRASAWIGNDPRFRLLRLPVADKTAQLNAALAQGNAEWVLVTDADARLPRGALQNLVRAALADPQLGAVGTAVVPPAGHPLEHLHWALSNRVRRLEAAAGSASLVVAPCYLVRRSILHSLPANVVADDVHASLRVAGVGLRTGLVADEVRELRTPHRLDELLAHKARKSEHYLRELWRARSAVGGMLPVARWAYFCRLAQFTLAPLLGLSLLLWAILAGWGAVPAVLLALSAAVLPAPVGRRLPLVARLPGLALLLTGSALIAVCRVLAGRRRTGRTAGQPTPVRIRGTS